MKVIFCDVDGVLNNTVTKERSPSGYTGVSKDLIRNLRAIVRRTGAKLVLSSDWRLVRDDPVHGRDYRYLKRKLYFTGLLSVTDHTDDISWNKRGCEIRKYLKDHPEVTEYVILDDLPFPDFLANGLLGHLVLTDRKKGLTETDAERAVRILEGKPVPPCDSSRFLENNFTSFQQTE